MKEALARKYNINYQSGSLFVTHVYNTLGIYLKIARSEISKIDFICIGYLGLNNYVVENKGDVPGNDYMANMNYT